MNDFYLGLNLHKQKIQSHMTENTATERVKESEQVEGQKENIFVWSK